MTNLDKADTPAKSYEYRAWNPANGDVIYLEDPRLIEYHPGYKLQTKDESGNWVTIEPPPAPEPHAEDIEG
jgi:hypothetical protein